MIDLIQLASLQTTVKELQLAVEREVIEDDSLKDSAGFPAILECFSLGEVNESIVITPEKNLKQQEENPAEFFEEMELMNSANFCENNSNNQKIADEKPTKVHYEISTEPKEEINLLIAANPQLAWFIASSFEAPGISLESSQEEISQTIPSSKTMLVTLTSVGNKKQGVGDVSATVLDEENEVTRQSTAATLDKPNKEELEFTKSISDYANDRVHIQLQSLAEQTKNSQNSIQSLVAERDLLQFNPEEHEMATVEQGSDKSLATISTVMANHLNSQPPVAAIIPAKTIELPQSIMSPEWGSGFNQQIIWLGQQKIKSATIQLNPQELGPLEVNIKVVKEAATVNITTHSAPVRDLIEQALPRLRDMMAEQGINLSQVNIESNSNHRQQYQQHDEKIQFEREINDEKTLATTPLPGRINKSLIDYFA